MRRLLSILLLITYLGSTTEFNQLLKIPVFFSHLQEHRMENPAISLRAFVTLHYFSGDVHDKDYERDMELPFKSHAYIAWSNPVTPPPSQPRLDTAGIRPVTVIYPSYINKFHPLTYHADIWQPPKNRC